ncbi:unnamed protein product [Sphagnum troendelagicum]
MTYQDVIRDLDRSLRPPRSTGHGSSSDQSLDDVSRPEMRPRSKCPKRPPVMYASSDQDLDDVMKTRY